MKRSAVVGKSLAGVCLAFASVLFGCSDDECKKGNTECISDSLYRVCVDGEDGPEWLVSQCGDNESCQSDVALPGNGDGDGDGDTDAGPEMSASAATTGDVCVGTCMLDERECVTDSLARFCIAGGIWQLDMCDVGERCVSGECVLSDEDGKVQRCEPGAMQCASDMIEKVCDPDGTAWIFQGCAANETCVDDRCAPDPASSCDDGNNCLDNKTQIRCLGKDQGFELVECQGDTYCQGGVCRGDNCQVGQFCDNTVNGQPQIRECTDGINLSYTTCEAGEVCKQNPDATAECVKPVCSLGATVCGDPNDTDVDATQFFSRCVTLPNTGVPGWIQGECIDTLTCDPAFAGSANPCRRDCTPGAQRCAPVGTTVGVNDGWQECGEDGTWGPVTRCNPGTDTRLLCNIKPNDDPAALPEAVCAAPVCSYALSTPGTGAEGACEGARIRRCNEDGTLAEAENCEMGICRNVTNIVTDDGRVPGACDMNVQCMEGEERCVDNGATPTPRYQTCNDAGVWSTTLQTCADDTICRDYLDDEGMSHKLCDAECTPGTRQCDGDGIQTCDADGKWEDATGCAVGTCSTLPNGDAACTVPCIPGTKRCVGNTIRTSDGVHSGTDSEQVCNDSGQWEAAEACSGSHACRTTSSGVTLGCVECLGSDAPGGNSEGLADTRCDGDDKTQACGADNTWQDSVTCSNGGTCVGPTPETCGACTGLDGSTLSVCNLESYQAVPRLCDSCTVTGTSTSTFLPQCTESAYLAAPDSCGTCTGPDGSTVAAPCTESAYLAVPVCGPCTVTTTGGNVSLATCSESMADAAEAGRTCADTNVGGTASAYAGVADCCLGAQTTYANLPSPPDCNPSLFAGVPNCCQAAQVTYGEANPSFTCNPATWDGTAECCEEAQQTWGDFNPSGSSLSCNPSAWGGEAECCAAGQEGGSGPSFAYCEAP